MRSLAWTLVVLGTLWTRSAVPSGDAPAPHEQKALDEALAIAGLKSAHLPIILMPELPPTVAPNAEAWTLFNEACKGARISVYTRSRVFLCASTPGPSQYQCGLKLASVLVHEAWHLRHGFDEAGAYEAQLTFLQVIVASSGSETNEAATAEIAVVRKSRDRVLAEMRRLRGTTGGRTGVHPCQSSAPSGS
jgi:hypothetical protein